jgi:tetratricopeptide (TPR) repeat protein
VSECAAPGGERRRAALCLALLLAAIVAVFSRGCANQWTHCDDDSLVFENPVQAHFGWRELRDAFDPRVPRREFGSQYTPLSDLSYALDRRLFGKDARWYHLQGMLFHALAAAALFGLARRLGASPGAALLAGAVFALHPVQVEAVTWIAGRRTAMAGAFTLAAMLAWARARGEGSRPAYAASIALALLANLSKQSAVVSAPLLAAVEWGVRARERASGGAQGRREAWPRTLLAYAPHAAITVGFVAIGLWIGRREEIIDPPNFPLALRAAISLTALGLYGGLLAWPARLQPIYRVLLPASFSDPRVLAGAAVLAAGLAATWLGRRRAPLLAVGLTVAGVALAPGLHALGTQIVADRYLYMSVAGVGLALAAGPAALGSRLRGAAGAALAAMVVALALATALRIGVWRNDFTLFADAVESDPENAISHRSLGLAYVRAGRLGEAEAELRRAAALTRERPPLGKWLLPRIVGELARVQEMRGDMAGAELSFEAGLSIAPAGDADIPAFSLAGFRERRGELEAARRACLRGIELDGERAYLCRKRLAELDGAQGR